ncbi:MAG: hypothetical protein GY757_35125 [bacterium]|nr:hypothetical protein [bacterium]
MKKLVTLLLILFIPITMFSTGNHFRFHHISIEDGLSNSTVYSICQDDRGFMWFGTEDGLSKYDGYEFTKYFRDRQSPHSLSSNNAGNIMKDRQGNLWVGTWGGGLNKFDPDSGYAVHFKHDPEKPGSISGNRIQSLYQDSKGNLWFGTFSRGLNKYNPGSGDFTIYVIAPEIRIPSAIIGYGQYWMPPGGNYG